MTKTIIGLFDTFGEAQNAVDDLMRFGMSREAISLVAREEQRPADYEHEVGSSAAEGAGAGALGGSLVGGALGLLVGTGLLVIPGIGPVLAAGPLAGAIGTITAAAGATALGAGIGAAAGGLLGGLMGAGVPEEDARVYVEGVRRGGTLLTVNASDVEADDVREIMVRNGAIDMSRRADEWRASGWGDPAIASDAALREQSAEAGLGREDAFRGESLADVDRQVVDPAYTNVDRTGERVKDSGYASGHEQPREHEPQAFSEFVADDERNFRTPVDTRTDAPASTGYRAESYNTIDSDASQRNDLASESGMRSERYAGADEMGGALSNMAAGSGSAQPGRAADQPGASHVRIYDRDDTARDTGDELPAHGDFARGQRSDEAPAVEPDFARGMHGDTVSERDRAATGEQLPGTPHHGDFARGMRDEGATAREPDFARGQRAFETYDNDFLAHYGSMTGAGGQPYDYYKPGYKFGYDLAHDRSYSHESWTHAERDARQSWERDARGSWEEFKDTIRYGWEKARGLR
jgi:hypothetical protein